MGKEETEDRPAGSATGGGTGKLEDYRLMGKLGEGTFSEVLKVKQKKSGRISAMKRFRKHFKSFEEIETLREIQALRRLNPHQHIVALEDVIFDPKHGILSLNFELMECNLYELISQRKTSALLTESKARLFMYQICKALEYIHGKGIFHRDIKPENILVKDNNIKIADFGSCRGIHSKQPYTEYIATRWYRPPECLLTAGFYSYKMDIWGAGCVLFEIVSRVPLFPGSNELDQLHRIHAVLGTPKKELLRYMAGSKAASAKYNFPQKEGTGIRALIPHVQMDCVELINALLAYNPDERISSKDALKYAYFKDMPDSELERSPTSRSAAASGGPFKTKSARRKGSLHNVSLSIPQLPTAVVVATGAKGGGGKKIETESDPDSRPVPTNTYLKSSKPAVTHSTTHNTTTTITTTITNKADAPSHHPAAHPATVIPTASGVAPTSTPPAGKQETQHHDSHQQQHPAIQQQHSLSSLLAKSGKPHHTTTTVAAAQLRTRQDPPADPPALTGGTLMAIAQHVRTGPFITSTSITTQQQPTQHQPVAASSSTTSLPPIAQMLTGGSTATGGTSTSAFYAKFKQDDKRAAAAVAAAVMDQGAPRLHGRLRASAGPNKKVPPRSLGQPQGGAQAAPSTDSKAPQWGATVVGKNAVVQSHKLPSIGPTQAHSIHPQHKSLHQAAAASSNTTVLPNLPSHMPKHETGDAKSRPKELLVLPSLGSEKTTSKQTTNHSTASPAPTVFPAIKHLGGSKPGGN